MKLLKIKKLLATSLISCLMLGVSVSPTFASAPSKEEVKYEGNGVVEVEYHGKVKYKKAKVVVKDTKGKKYSVKLIKKGKDETKFKIKNLKKGKTYKFTIKGVKKAGTKKYGKVSGKVYVPAAKKATAKKVVSQAVDAAKAKQIALKDAASRYGIDTSKIFAFKSERDRDDGRYEYEIEFKCIKNGVVYEYEYDILESNGSIIKAKQEIDD